MIIKINKNKRTKKMYYRLPAWTFKEDTVPL